MFRGWRVRKVWIVATVLPTLLLAWFGLFSLYGQATALPITTSALDEVIPGADYAPWFETHTGYQGDDSYFGVYAVKALADTIYLGFGAARPAEADGALFASYSGGITTTAIADLDEQGFIDMTIVPPTVYIPGTDPCCGDGWAWGNIYTYTHNQPLSFVKHRNLPHVLHTWKLLKNKTSGALYAVTGSQTITTNMPIDDWEWTAEIYRSDDDGLSWNRLANRDGSTVSGMEGTGDSVGNYRTYDMVEFNNKLFINWNDYYLADPPDLDSLTFVCGLAESSDNGNSWIRLTDYVTNTTACRQRLHIFDKQLLVLMPDGSGLRALQTDGSILTYLFPDFKAAEFAYNLMTNDKIYLYILGENGRILRTSDLINWDNLEATDREFITIEYWPAQDQIIVADRGDDATLWQFAPSAANINPVPQHLAQVDITIVGEALQLDWNASSVPKDRYRVYRATEPYFDRASHSQELLRMLRIATLLDANLDGADVVGDVATNYFYLVRTEDSNGRIGLKSNKIGEFDFAIVAGSS